MNCCRNCFADKVIASTAHTSTIGKCDFCHSANVELLNLHSDDANDLRNLLTGILTVYMPLPDNSDGEGQYISEILHEELKIFSLQHASIKEFLKDILINDYSDYSAYLERPVTIPSSTIEQNSFLGKSSWDEFSHKLKIENRFHAELFHGKHFESFLKGLENTIDANTQLYRARVWIHDRGYSKKEMGAPPPDKATAGRINPEGMSYLYLSADKDTTLYETRALIYDRVTIGKFKLADSNQHLKIVDLTRIDQYILSESDDCTLYVVNKNHLTSISKQISKAQRRYEKSIEYVPTQYICDFIKSKGYDGIKYASTVKEGGINYAIFNPTHLKCCSIETKEIANITYA